MQIEPIPTLMKLESILSELRNKVPAWRPMRALLKANGFPVSSGWDTTISKILKHQELETEDVPSVEILEKFLTQLIIVNDKTVSVYQDGVDLEELNTQLSELVPEKTPFSEVFPYSVSKQRLLDCDEEPTLTKTIVKDDGCYLIFCCKRTFVERIQLDSDYFESIGKEVLSGFDEIIGKRTITRQFFDVVHINPATNQIDIRIDYGKGINAKEIQIAMERVAGKFSQIAHDLAGVKVCNIDANLFKAVYNLYDSDIGRVCEIAFECNNESVHHERYRKERKDIREETFHVGGKGAVGDINPYRLAVAWDLKYRDEGVTPELMLAGRRAMLREAFPLLRVAFIENCLTLGHFNFILDKLITNSNAE